MRRFRNVNGSRWTNDFYDIASLLGDWVIYDNFAMKMLPETFDRKWKAEEHLMKMESGT